MNEQELFQELKKRILESYRNHYPYFSGNWKNFSSKDIRQLIELIETELRESVSEKWIYTHLKPEKNEKLPRKDMLDIFACFAGFSDWNEFSFKLNEVESEEIPIQKVENKKKFNKKLWFLVLIPILILGIYRFIQPKKSKTVTLKNEFTKKPVQTDEIKVYKLNENQKTPVEVVESKIELEDSNEKILIESPYFEQKEVQISDSEEEIFVKPEDYALVLKTFIDSDLSDWTSRKEKLEKILSEDLEVIILLKENLGAEYLNKEEFAQKLIVPTSETKKLKILNLETNENKEITFIRIQQL